GARPPEPRADKPPAAEAAAGEGVPAEGAADVSAREPAGSPATEGTTHVAGPRGRPAGSQQDDEERRQAELPKRAGWRSQRPMDRREHRRQSRPGKRPGQGGG